MDHLCGVTFCERRKPRWRHGGGCGSSIDAIAKSPPLALVKLVKLIKRIDLRAILILAKSFLSVSLVEPFSFSFSFWHSLLA